MNNYLAILADIKSKLTAVPDIGVVNEYERWINDPDKFLACFSIPNAARKKEVRGWDITRVSAREQKRGNTYFRLHRFKAALFMGLQDDAATEKIFQVLIDTVCSKFRAGEPVDGDAAPWFYMDGPNSGNSCVQAETIDTRMFGAVLCHHADIYITVTERIIA